MSCGIQSEKEFDRLLVDGKLHYVVGVLWAYLADFCDFKLFSGRWGRVMIGL